MNLQIGDMVKQNWQDVYKPIVRIERREKYEMQLGVIIQIPDLYYLEGIEEPLAYNGT